MYKDVLHEAEKILRWRNLPHLMLVHTNALHIPERVNEYHPNLFVVFNARTKGYEIHSIAGGSSLDSKQCDVHFDGLDARVLQFLWEQDIRVHGKEIFRRIQEDEDKAKAKRKKRHGDRLYDIAKDTRTIFARMSWGDNGQVVFPSAAIKRIGGSP